MDYSCRSSCALYLVVEVAHHHFLSTAAVHTDCSPCTATISSDRVQMKFQVAARNLCGNPTAITSEAQSFRVPHIVILSDICQFDRPTACPQRPPTSLPSVLSDKGGGRRKTSIPVLIRNSPYFPQMCSARAAACVRGER